MQGLLVSSRYCCCFLLADGETEAPSSRATHPRSQLVRGRTEIQTQEVWLQNLPSELFPSAATQPAWGGGGEWKHMANIGDDFIAHH